MNQPISVLLVEDHTLMRLGLRISLEKAEDIRVVGEAGDGLEALAKVEALSPDVVVMDLGLPKMDGLEATARIRGQEGAPRVLVLTSYDDEHKVLAALRAGAEAYCLKDLSEERLAAAVRAVHQGTVWLDGAVARHVLDRRLDSGEAQLRVDAAQAGVLSEREQEVLQLLGEGLSNQEIAEKLIISLATVKTHVRHILQRLDVEDRAQAVIQALHRGLLKLG